MSTISNSSHPSPLDVLYQGADDLLHHIQGLVASDKVADFIASVRWDEAFIRTVLLGQVILFLFTYLTRKYEVVQFMVLLIMTAITLGAERINEFASRNWSKFATQDYFDSTGLFMMVFVSGPFVLLANFIVIGMGLRLVKLYMKRLRMDARRKYQQSQMANRPSPLTTSAEKKDS
eukprot:GFKZ01012759.1.p1 GENE.GFKZ01012759.1~~GFKZ01012759.1.p1  ORF type:complete len:176 (+),score=23.43 GFKZ01012759.1:238-765(+)